MKITAAVRRAIEEGDDSVWSVYVRGGCAHHLHVSIRCAPDGFDADIMKRLARDGISNRGGLTHVERRDGTLKPSLILPRDCEPSFEQGHAVAGGRRVSDKVTA